MIVQRMMVRGVKTVPDAWQFTVNTEATTPGEKKTGVPLNLYGQDGVTVTVDWGDGTESVLTPADFAKDDSTASVHEYAEAGVYTVAISSKKFPECYLLSIDSLTSISTINNAVAPLYWYRRTLISVDTILPNVAGKNYYTSPTSVSSLNEAKNYLSFLFSGCNKCTTIPSGLFNNNTSVTNFSNCFNVCSSLTAIPVGLFDNNTAVTIFSNCFRGCSSLTAIPAGLFDNNTTVTNFANCFNGCSSLAAIPAGLFGNNTTVTNFNYCFRGCSSLADFIVHVGSSIVNNASSFVSQKTGATRTIYVPSGSTTETTFNAVASSLGLTIIGE